MARRRKMSNAVSKTIFQKTANKTNSMNVKQFPTNGGTHGYRF